MVEFYYFIHIFVSCSSLSLFLLLTLSLPLSLSTFFLLLAYSSTLQVTLFASGLPSPNFSFLLIFSPGVCGFYNITGHDLILQDLHLFYLVYKYVYTCIVYIIYILVKYEYITNLWSYVPVPTPTKIIPLKVLIFLKNNPIKSFNFSKIKT